MLSEEEIEGVFGPVADSPWPSWQDASRTEEQQDSCTNTSGNAKGEEVEHLLATNVSASGGLGEEEGSSSTNASRDDSRNARAWETSWHGWVCRHWTTEEWDEWALAMGVIVPAQAVTPSL